MTDTDFDLDALLTKVDGAARDELASKLLVVSGRLPVVAVPGRAR